MLGIENSSARLLPKGTVALCRTASVGKTAILGRSMATSQDFVDWVCGPNLLPEYLYEAFRASGEAFDKEKQGTTHHTIYMPTVKRFKILLPPLSEQKRIADILDKAAAIRRKRQEILATIDELLRSSFYTTFGDPLHNPHKWPLHKLGEVAILDRGRSRHRPRDAAFLYGGPYPFVQTGDITNSNGFVRNYSQTYSEDGLAQSKLWPVGTLCITIAANIAKTAVLTFDACFPDSVVGLIPGDSLTTEYVRQWFVAMEKAIDAAATQVAQKNINLQILRDLEIQLPPIELQKQFADHVNALRRIRETAVAISGETDDLFNSLVQRAFKGEL
jgi:type I restriction enzyme S subunit